MAFAMRAAVAVFCLGLSAGAAQAATQDIKFTGNSSPVGFDSSITLSYNGSTVTTAVGPLEYATKSGATFLTYCVELSAEASTSFQTYTETTFSASVTKLLGGLFSATSLLSNKVDTVEEYAAMALAVWEITQDSASTLSLSSGNLYVKSTDTQSKTEVSLANSYLQAAQSWTGASLFNITKLTNSTYQDQVKVTPVPEPTTLATMALGLVGIGAVARRRRQS